MHDILIRLIYANWSATKQGKHSRVPCVPRYGQHLIAYACCGNVAKDLPLRPATCSLPPCRTLSNGTDVKINLISVRAGRCRRRTVCMLVILRAFVDEEDQSEQKKRLPLDLQDGHRSARVHQMMRQALRRMPTLRPTNCCFKVTLLTTNEHTNGSCGNLSVFSATDIIIHLSILIDDNSCCIKFTI
eukprot:SAG11_NODE_4832_length_1750_cov_1.284504_4_plen_187_part_00